MRATWSVVFVLVFAAPGDSDGNCKCNAVIHQYYTELGCKPVYVEGKCCPKEYDCRKSLDERDPYKCYLNGNVYESGVDIEDVDGEACAGPSCQCEGGVIDCTLIVDCPEYHEDLPEGCEHQYTKGECCPTGKLCVNPSIPGVTTCQYDGHTYAAGQYIYQWDEPCLSCLCQEGFDGTLNGPWCTNISCHYNLLDSERIVHGCAPIFYDEVGSCCAIGWRCSVASELDTVVPAIKPSKSNRVCKFGDLTLSLGDSLSEVPCIKCYCVMPPHVVCLHARECNSTLTAGSLGRNEDFTARTYLSPNFMLADRNRSPDAKSRKDSSTKPF